MQLDTTIDTFLSPNDKLLALAPPELRPLAEKDTLVADRTPRPSPAFPGVGRFAAGVLTSVERDMWLLQHSNMRIRSKNRLLNRYVRDCDRLRQTAKELGDFVHDCVFASLVFDNPRASLQNTVQDTLVDVTEKLSRDLLTPLVPPGIETTSDMVATHDAGKLQARLSRSLKASCRSLVKNFFAVLQRGTERFVFGRVLALEGDGLSRGTVCPAARYWYFTRLVEKGAPGVRGPDAVRAIALHVHDVVDAKVVKLPAWLVRKPQWMEPVIYAVPRVLRRVPDAVTVVTGNITLESVFVQGSEPQPAIRQRSFPLLFEPALVVANTFVLTGWNPTDLRSRSKLREWTPSTIPVVPWHQTSEPVGHLRRSL